jgi:hypothetical protein
MHEGHFKLCLDAHGSSEWKSFEFGLLHALPDARYCHAIIHALRLMMKADCLGLSSALQLPEIKILKHCTDLRSEITAMDLIHSSVLRSGIDLYHCLKLREYFSNFKVMCPSLVASNMRAIDFIVLHTLLAQKLHFSKFSGIWHSAMILTFAFANQQANRRTGLPKDDTIVKWIEPEHATQALEFRVISKRSFAAKEVVRGPELLMTSK